MQQPQLIGELVSRHKPQIVHVQNVEHLQFAEALHLGPIVDPLRDLNRLISLDFVHGHGLLRLLLLDAFLPGQLLLLIVDHLNLLRELVLGELPGFFLVQKVPEQLVIALADAQPHRLNLLQEGVSAQEALVALQ